MKVPRQPLTTTPLHIISLKPQKPSLCGSVCHCSSFAALLTMKISHSFWASAALLVPAAFAESSEASAASATTTSAPPSCTASLITKLCDYPTPGPEFAVASSGEKHCLQYCNDHQPCDFVIFAAGNPNTGTGTCWVYPGKTFDANAGSTDCGSPVLSVFDKPVCAGGPTPTHACAAIATPSAVASVCEYPAPDNCFQDCVAAEGAPQCLQLCVEADSCSYAVFNARNPSKTPYASGTCWIYQNGTYDAEAGSSCSEPEQFVYTNPCPKLPPASPSVSSSATSSSEPTADTGSDSSPDSVSNPQDGSACTAGLSYSTFFAFGLFGLIWQGAF
jgi:hypothetical protein